MSKAASGSGANAKPARRASGERAPSAPLRKERTVQSSVSLKPSQWARLDVLGDLTQWGRSGALAQAVDLLMALPVTVAQRLATLKRTTAGTVLQRRLQAAVEDAISAAEAELSHDPWAEFDAALAAIGTEVKASGVAEMSERELTDAAEAGKRAYRRARRDTSGPKPATR
jgi:hypothetical protein